MLIPVTAAEQTAIQKSADTLDLYLVAAEGFRTTIRDGAKPTSPIGRADSNKHLSWHPDSADIRIRGAVDHGETVLSILRGGTVPRIALYTLVRAMLEADAVAYWLLEPESVGELRKRRIIDRGYQAFRRLRATGTQTTRRAAGVARQVNAVLPRAASKTSTFQSLKVAYETRPAMTKLVKELLGEDLTYNWLSGYAHAENWAVTDGFVNVGAAGPSQSYARIEANIRRCLLFLNQWYGAHEHVMTRWVSLSGGDQAAWDAIRDGIPAKVP